MKAVISPWLWRLVLGVGVLWLVVFLGGFVHRTDWNRERHLHALLTGRPEKKVEAAVALARLDGESHLLRALRAAPADSRELAERALWLLWFHEGGEKAYRMTVSAQAAMDEGDYELALQTLDALVRSYPDFAEGWNRRATLLWMLGDYEGSVADCETTLRLNPNHFAAWQGMGLCHIHMGNLEAACEALRVSLRIRPHDYEVQQLLLRCESLQRRLPRVLLPGGNLI